MEGKRIKVFGVVMALLLVFSLAATLSVSSTSTVSAGTQKWSKINIPGTDDMQLAPGTDVGAMDVSPDGAALFAAVFDTAAGTWNVTKSIDGGYTWKLTGLTAAYLASASDSTDIIAIDVSPAWENDEIVVVTTVQDVYISEDAGKTFKSMDPGNSLGDNIRCMDIGIDEDGDATYAVGTTTDVYILSGFSGWARQYIYTPLFINAGGVGVLAVAFSPNYANDGTVLAVIRGQAPLDLLGPGTWLRAESDITVNNWGAYINDAPFTDQEDGTYILADSACMDFADDYNSVPVVFVGIVAYSGGAARGDAFRVDLTSGAMGTSAVEDLDIRGTSTASTSRTNVTSIQVSGDASSAYILVGLRDLANSASMSDWVGQVHYSNNGGESWLQCYKPPSGIALSSGAGYCAPILVLAPDFATSGIVYCSNGYLRPILGVSVLMSGVSVSTTKGTTFNGRGLLDYYIDSIEDIEPSPKYETDKTLFMLTRDNTSLFGLLVRGFLWETKDGGYHWELILGMTLAIPIPGVTINTIEIPATYNVSPAVFVNGQTSMLGPASTFARSTDEGNLFATIIKGPTLALVPQVISTWKVIDEDTLIVASASKIWKTTDMGAHWTEAEDVNLGTDTVLEMKLYDDTTVLVGTEEGNVYICQDLETDFSFVQVDEGPGASSDWTHIAFDTNCATNGIIYAGIDTGSDDGSIWRIDTTSGDPWEKIYDDGVDIYSIACDGNGILWATTSDGKPIREVNPTDEIDNIAFQVVTDGLATLDYTWEDIETAPTQTYVFANGEDASGNLAIWAYIDTLIKPTLISPADGTTAAGTIIEGNSLAHVSLMWDDLAKAKAYDYQVAYDTSFGSIAVEGTINGSQTAASLFLGEKFYWRVRVNGSVWSQWSETWTFTTPLGPASAKPVCMSPTEGLTGVIRTPALQWSSSVEATGFELMVAANCDWTNAIVNLTGSSALGSETAYQITTSLAEGTNYCWKVRAINADTATNSPWSDTGTFTTLVTPVVEEAGTPVWVWVVIALSAVLLVGVVVLIVRTRRPV
jgi:hypothetical protein